MPEERILIITVNGDCRYIRYIPNKPGDPDVYCAANPHSEEWERIAPEDCKTCKREKYLEGMAYKDAVNIVENAMKTYAQDNEVYTDRDLAKVAINALLGKEIE